MIVTITIFTFHLFYRHPTIQFHARLSYWDFESWLLDLTLRKWEANVVIEDSRRWVHSWSVLLSGATFPKSRVTLPGPIGAVCILELFVSSTFWCNSWALMVIQNPSSFGLDLFHGWVLVQKSDHPIGGRQTRSVRRRSLILNFHIWTASSSGRKLSSWKTEILALLSCTGFFE